MANAAPESDLYVCPLYSKLHPAVPLPLRIDFPPTGLQFRHPVIDSGSQIDRHFDIDFMTRIDLRPQQIEI